MKLSIAFALAALMITGFLAAGTQQASAAVIYCQYVDYPAGCVARPGVVLRVRPVPGTPANRGGPVDRAGRR